MAIIFFSDCFAFKMSENHNENVHHYFLKGLVLSNHNLTTQSGAANLFSFQSTNQLITSALEYWLVSGCLEEYLNSHNVNAPSLIQNLSEVK